MNVILLIVLVILPYAIQAGIAPLVGRSTWVYDVAGGAPAMWSVEIGNFNTNNTAHSLNVILSYGGDMEYYPGSTNPYQTYFSTQSIEAVKKYKKVTGVDHVLAVVDGRMDGGQEWSPDLSKLTAVQVQEWADLTAAIYCSYEDVSGIVVDLEPFEAPYAANLLVFIERLGQDVINKNFGCVNSRYPEGRYLATFLFAAAATPQVFDALGPNGFVIISGYDLSTAPAGVPSTPSQFGAALSQSLSILMTNAGTTGYFSVALPAAASVHEFSQYVPSGGSAVAGYPMYNETGDSYIKEAFKAMSSSGIESHPGFLGRNLWAFSTFMQYPPHTYNLYYPTNPFVQDGEEAFLRANL